MIELIEQQQETSAVNNGSMNIRIKHDIWGITGVANVGRNDVVALKPMEMNGALGPCNVMYRGSSSHSTPKDALEFAGLMAKAAQIGAILDEIKEFPQRLVGSGGYVSLEIEITGHNLQIAIHGDGGAENAFNIFANLLSILSQVTSSSTVVLLGKVDADSWRGLRSKISSEQFQNLAKFASSIAITELIQYDCDNTFAI